MGRGTATNARFEIGALVFRFRNVLVPLVVVVLAASARGADFLVPAALDPWVDALGIAVIGLGLAIRLATIGRSRVRRSGVRKALAVPTLYVDGPYASCRNPLYLANATILFGVAMLFDSRWMVGVALPTAWAAIAAIVAAEERVLEAKFGARYREYRTEVPRFLPRDPRALVSLGGVDWRHALRKEHGPIFATVSVVMLLGAAEDVARNPTAVDRLPTRVAAWLVIAVAWTGVRVAKGVGLLRTDPAAHLRCG